MNHRTCSKCGVSKPETPEFYGKRGTKDRGGLRPDCKICKREGDRLSHLRNQEKRLAAAAAYRAANKAQIAARDRRYLDTPQGWATRIAANERWRKAHPEVYVLARQRRRAAVVGANADYTRRQWAACRDWFQHHCAYCGEYRKLTQDHLVPFAAGGQHTANNVVPACRSCNCRKNASLIEDWYPRQSFYSVSSLARIHEYVASVGSAHE